jgi:type VI secretion system protein ImpF
MSELTTLDKLQPSLLDRLTDDEPDSKVESREKRVMSMRQLRSAVLRDLSWLLNAGNNPVSSEIYDFPLVAKSVVNYGMPDMTGLAASGLSAAQLEQMVLDAILAFETRIVSNTLTVRIKSLDEPGGSPTAGNRVGFEISGELCPLPMPEALFVRTEVDLETGQYDVKG